MLYFNWGYPVAMGIPQPFIRKPSNEWHLMHDSFCNIGHTPSFYLAALLLFLCLAAVSPLSGFINAIFKVRSCWMRVQHESLLIKSEKPKCEYFLVEFLKLLPVAWQQTSDLNSHEISIPRLVNSLVSHPSAQTAEFILISSFWLQLYIEYVKDNVKKTCNRQTTRVFR